MSLEIDWSLLSSFDHCHGFIQKLNSHLEKTTWPSFVGPVSVTAWDFGDTGPEIEIQHIGDVWKAFEEADEEADEEQSRQAIKLQSPPLADATLDFAPSRLGNVELGYSNVFETVSSRSSPRQVSAVRSVGLGVRMGVRETSGLRSLTTLPGRSRYELESTSSRSESVGNDMDLSGKPLPEIYTTQSPNIARECSPQCRTTISESSPQPSPHVGQQDEELRSTTNIPSIQFHLRYHHASNLSMTLLTSLQINYPSKVFMSLPVKLVITGFTINAQIVVAYTGENHRIKFALVEPLDSTSGDSGRSESSSQVNIGQKLLPHLQVESEIGHSDAHVLRNVGKIERLILDVVRGLLVQELVWPNFHTIVM